MSHNARSFLLVETLLATACSVILSSASVAATCPFDSGSSDALNDGVVLTRYALGITGAPMTASTRYASLDPLQVKNNIECVGCALDMNGDGQIDAVDTTIIARHLTGFTGASLTGGLALGAGSRNTTAAVTSFLANGCAVGGAISAFTQGGNAFGVPAVLGTTDGQALTVGVGGGDGLRIVRRTDPTNGAAINVTNGDATNRVQKVCLPGAAGLPCVSSPSSVVGGTVGGGGNTANPNLVTDSFGAVGGGFGNRAGNSNSDPNDALGATVGGGVLNNASGSSSTVAGGDANLASGRGSTVAGGDSNEASGTVSTVPGGYRNVASGDYSFAAGHDAIANWNQCAIFGLWSTFESYGCGAFMSNTFRIGADKGLYVEFNSQAAPNFINFGNFTAGRVINTASTAHLTFSGVWTNASDRALKQHLKPIDAKRVLQKVLALPVTTWNYITEGNATRRMGPMAQDFYAAFRLGSDDKTIGTVDAHGVALAAIQGLNQKLTDEVKAKGAEIAELRSRLATIERRLSRR